MRKARKNENVMDELSLKQCTKCECLILSESSELSCLKLSTNTVKNKLDLPFEASAQIADKPKNASLGILKSDYDKDDEMTQIMCFGLCRRKKRQEIKNEVTNTQSNEFYAQNTQTVSTNNVKTQCSDTSLQEIIKTYTTFSDKPGNCNTNTIIFPRDKNRSEGFAHLEELLRTETKQKICLLEEILNDLNKQRRDIRELKDMLDSVVRAVHEQLFLTAFGKGRSELFEDLKRAKNLERKSNTLSMPTSSENKETEQKPTIISEIQPTSEEKKELSLQGKRKKRSFPWCT